MRGEAIAKAVELCRKVGHLFVATASREGQPHVGTARTIERLGDDTVGISGWYCPGTENNLRDNRRAAVVVWDTGRDRGYQLLGTVEAVEEKAFLDGYTALEEQAPPIPQVEKRIRMRVESVVDFTIAPHSDREEQA